MAKTQRPDIWLQDEEASGEGDCGCELLQNRAGSGAALYYCKTHAAAPELLAALLAVEAIAYWEGPATPEYLAAWAQARAVIAKATKI